MPDARSKSASTRAGKIAPQDQGKRRRFPIVIGAHLPIRAVDAGGKGIDDDLARAGGRIRKVAVLQDLGSSELFDVNSLHGFLAFAT